MYITYSVYNYNPDCICRCIQIYIYADIECLHHTYINIYCTLLNVEYGRLLSMFCLTESHGGGTDSTPIHLHYLYICT